MAWRLSCNLWRKTWYGPLVTTVLYWCYFIGGIDNKSFFFSGRVSVLAAFHYYMWQYKYRCDTNPKRRIETLTNGKSKYDCRVETCWSSEFPINEEFFYLYSNVHCWSFQQLQTSPMAIWLFNRLIQVINQMSTRIRINCQRPTHYRLTSGLHATIHLPILPTHWASSTWNTFLPQVCPEWMSYNSWLI